jgi:hypothetical protein
MSVNLGYSSNSCSDKYVSVSVLLIQYILTHIFAVSNSSSNFQIRCFAFIIINRTEECYFQSGPDHLIIWHHKFLPFFCKKKKEGKEKELGLLI